MRSLFLTLVLLVTTASAAHTAPSGTLLLNTPAPVAGGVAEFLATIEGLPPLEDGNNAAFLVGNVDLQCYQNDVLVLDYPQTTLFRNTSTTGFPYVIEFPLRFTGSASCEAHLFTYKVTGSTKPSNRTKANTLVTVPFIVQP